MNIKKILENNTLSLEVIKNFFKKKVEGTFTEEHEEQFKEFALNHALNTTTIESYIQSIPRILFDVLDENDIFCSISKNKNNITCNVQGDTNKQYFNTRRQAEEYAVEKGIILLEEKLKL